MAKKNVVQEMNVDFSTEKNSGADRIRGYLIKLKEKYLFSFSFGTDSFNERYVLIDLGVNKFYINYYNFITQPSHLIKTGEEFTEEFEKIYNFYNEKKSSTKKSFWVVSVETPDGGSDSGFKRKDFYFKNKEKADVFVKSTPWANASEEVCFED